VAALAALVMAGILSRYIIVRILLAMALVGTVLVSIYTLIDLIREARSLGGGYGVVEMLVYVARTMPRRLYDLFPFIALIGTLTGLGALAGGNELVAMRAAGFDRHHLATRVLAAVVLCLVLLAALSEWVIPEFEKNARAERQQARTGQLHLGAFGSLWLRDGQRMIRIGRSAWAGDDELEFSDLTVYELGGDMQPRTILVAERGRHRDGRWELFGVARRDLDSEAELDRAARLQLDSGLNPDLFVAAVSRPKMLSLRDLVAMQAFLERNELNADPYAEALWARLVYPINVIAIVLIGLPFVFSGPRQSGRGVSVFAGVVLGLMFFVLTRLTQGVSALLPVPLWLSSLFPGLIIFLLAVWLLRRP
jgi:lipopolysaccharide export system permease protein